MCNGGYKLVDLKNLDITVGAESGVSLPGIYDEIENNFRKPIVITGLHIGGVECSDRFLNFRPISGAWVGEIGFNSDYLHLMLKITDDDMIFIFEQ